MFRAAVLGTCVLALAACGGQKSTSTTTTSSTSSGLPFTWKAGSDTVNASGVYGTQGIPSSTNTPGSRFDAVSWTDASGNLWLFGGDSSVLDFLNDLWEYDPSSGQWAWISGSDTINASGVYGTQGIPAAGNVPGARYAAVSWTDTSGNLWLFGGLGYGSLGLWGRLNDLWEFSPSSGQWTWMGGSSGVDATGVYGTQGVAAAGNVPGARVSAVSWTDASGNLWLFGGKGIDSAGSLSSLNDLWEYSPSSGQWTWINGSNIVDASGLYGTQGSPSSTNMPGARDSAVGWIDASDNLWLFGGNDASSNKLNDLWEYSPSSNQWTWMSGSNSANAVGIYGTLGTPAATNVPGARWDAVGWSDASGTLWLFGGEGYDSVGNYFVLNDLWEYNPSSGQWTWVDGSNITDATGVYGTLGTPAASNIPGARTGASNWVDTSGNMWLFGGDGQNMFNDLWAFTPQ